jgi:integrase
MQGHVRKRHKPDCAKRRHPAGGKQAHLSTAEAAALRRQTRCSCDGSWQGRYRREGGLPDDTKWIEKTFRTRAEAEDWLTAQQASIMQGDWIDPRKAERPFSEVVEAWREGWTNRLSPTTASRYRGVLDLYLIPTFGASPIGRITHEVVQRYVNRLTSEGMTPGTVRNVYSVMRNVMNRGVRLGMVKVNPCTNIDLPRSPREEMLILTPEQVRLVAEQIDEHYRVMVYTAAYTGIRAGELLALRRADVDLLRGVLHVRRALKDVDGVLTFGPTKTHADRTIVLPAFLREMLRTHLTQPLGGTEADALAFPSKTGKPLRHNLFYRRHFKPTVTGYEKADGTKVPGALPADKHGVRWHDLRHTAASLAIHAGGHPLMVSKMLGHASVEITLNRYSHLLPNVAEALAEKLDALYVAAETAHPEPDNVKELRAKKS